VRARAAHDVGCGARVGERGGAHRRLVVEGRRGDNL
jgi:hypothetical protein